MCNSGFSDEERRYRDAAAEVRAGLSFEEMRAVEQQMLGRRRPGPMTRMRALAAQGEYDGPGGIDAGAGSALGDALDESAVTDSESGASQLLSTAASNGLSDPYSSAQAGWVATPESVDPYTGVAGAGSDDGSAFTGGQSVDPYTNAAPEDDNPNWFTGSQNVNPLSGDQDTDPFNTSDTQSLLSSPYLLAQNTSPTNANVASDVGGPNYIGPVDTGSATTVSAATDFTPQVSDVAADTGGSTYVGQYTENGVTYFQFADISGFVYEVQADASANSSTAPGGTTAPGGPGTASPVVPAPTAPPTATPGPALTDQNASPAPDPAAPPPDPTQTQQAAAPPPDPLPAPPQPGTATVPFDPMADSPVAKWLLYGTDTPVLDFLTNDRNLQVAQNVALGVAVVAGTIATGGVLLEAAPEILAFGNTAVVSATPTVVTVGGAAGGILATHPEIPQEIEEGVDALGPQLESSLATLEPELENTISTATPTGPSFQGLIDLEEFENDPQVIDRLGRARQFDLGGYQSLTGRGEFGRVGDNLDSDEALQNAYIRLFRDVGRVSDVTRDNPAIALDPQLHRLIQNLQTPQLQNLTPNQALQYHLQQMTDFTPDYVLRTLERESQLYIDRTF
jgi:hypothetical protein